MKKLVLRLFMVMCMMTISSTIVNAQHTKPGVQKTERKRMTREQLAETQARHICNELHWMMRQAPSSPPNIATI